MVQFKVTASLLLAAAAIVPAVAYPVKAEDSVVTREENEIAGSFARGFDLELGEREFDEELYEREPYPALAKLGKLASSAAGIKARKGLRATRELTDEELYERAIRSSKSVSGSVPHYTRELTKDVLDREFDEELYGRARGKQIANAAKSSKGAREFNDDLLDRGFDEELYGRAGAKSIAKAGNWRSKRVASALGGREFNDDLLEREFDEELYGRAGGRAIKLNSIRPIRKGIAPS